VGGGGGSVGTGDGLLAVGGGGDVGDAGAGASVGAGVPVAVGAEVGEGVNVLLGKARTMLVRAGVGVAVGREDAHCVIGSPTKSRHRTRHRGRRFTMRTSAMDPGLHFPTTASDLKVTRHKTRRWRDGC
jgi:hypothetical protein